MIPKYLSLKNFLSHDFSVIDFDKFDAALILGSFDGELDQSNGSGKSAIFESISWALFGKSRHKKKDGVIKWDKRNCEVLFDFWIDNDLYRIKRSRDKVIGDADVGFMMWDGSQFQDISCNTKTATDKKIASTISVNYEVFINSVYFKQNDVSMFAQSTPSKRKDILKSLLKLEKWDDYQKKARDKAKYLSTQIEAKSLNLVSIDKIKEEVDKRNTEIEALKKDIKFNNKNHVKISGDLVEKRLELNSIGDININEELKKLQRELASDQKRLAEIQKQRETNNKSIEYSNSQVTITLQKIRLLREKIKLAKDINITDLRFKTYQGESKEKILREKINDLEKKLNLEGECNVCQKPLTKKEIATIITRRENELGKLKTKHDILKDKLKRAAEKLKEKELVKSEGARAEVEKGKQDLRLVKLRNTAHDCEVSNERIDAEESTLRSKNLKPQIGKMQALVDTNGIEKLKTAISDMESELVKIKRNVDKLNIEYGSKVRRKEELDRVEKEQTQLQKEIAKIKSEHAILDKLKNYFGKEGIQSVIIENVIEELENYSNDLLTKICNDPMSLSIKTQKQNDNGSWAETFDIEITSGARTDDFETYSGGEGFRISLALRLALSHILATRMGGVIKFLLLDEVGSSLDNKGIEMFIDIVKKLSDEMKILIITHDEKLKDKLENIIMVNKSSSGSKAVLK